MATYTLTIDLTGFVWPASYVELISTTNSIELVPNYLNIEDLTLTLCSEITSYLNDGGTCTSSFLNETITIILTPNNDPPLGIDGDLVAIRIMTDEGVNYSAPFIPVEVEVCQTCQEVSIDNCGSIIFQAAIPNGTYEVQIEDHQSGITYMQDIEFTGSQGTWDQTNTAGVFTPFSTYTVTILDESGDPVSWIDGTNEYTCMRLIFATFTDTTPAA